MALIEVGALIYLNAYHERLKCYFACCGGGLKRLKKMQCTNAQWYKVAGKGSGQTGVGCLSPVQRIPFYLCLFTFVISPFIFIFRLDFRLGQSKCIA